jgi:hypothetical protein
MDIERLKEYLLKWVNQEALDASVPVGGWEAVEIIWPLFQVFQVRNEVLNQISYDKRLEAKADKAILAYIEVGNDEPWRKLAPNVLRVLCERTTQFMTVCLANEIENNPIAYLPLGLTADQKRCALMLYGLSKMKLPFPVTGRGNLLIPEGDVPPSDLLQ